MIEDGVNGRLVTPDSVEEMAEALELYFTDPAAVQAMQKKGMETANALTEEKVAAMILSDCGF